MKCLECGTTMKTRRETIAYDECGLRHVRLVGVSVTRCQQCGNHEITIPHLEGLHRLLARSLIEKATRFRGEEIRFLRKSLGWSGAEFAKHMGVAVETVSRWENDAAPIGPQADRLLRFLVAQGRLSTHYPTERLKHIDLARAATTRLTLAAGRRQWHVEAA